MWTFLTGMKTAFHELPVYQFIYRKVWGIYKKRLNKIIVWEKHIYSARDKSGRAVRLFMLVCVMVECYLERVLLKEVCRGEVYIVLHEYIILHWDHNLFLHKLHDCVCCWCVCSFRVECDVVSVLLRWRVGMKESTGIVSHDYMFWR